MKWPTLEKTKVILVCDKISVFSLYAVAYFFPISKALIETFTTLAIVCFLIKKFCQFQDAPKTGLNLNVLAFLAVCFASVLVSTNFGISVRNFIGKATEHVLFFFAAVDTLNNRRRVKIFLTVLFVSATLLGIDGIYQYFTHKDFIRNRPSYGLPRIHTTFPTPNDFGCYLYSVIPFVLVYFFGKFSKNKSMRAYSLFLFALLFACLVLTVSRGAWFAFSGALIFMSFWIRSLRFFILGIAAFVIATRNFYEPMLKERLRNPFIFWDTSSQDRRMIWQAGWKMFLSRPWLGLGLGTFMFNFDRFVIKGYKFSAPYAHNCYLQMAAELGIIGLVSFLTIIVLFFWRGIRALNTKDRTFFWYVLLASLAGMLAYCLQMAMDTILYSLDLGMLFWLLLALGTLSVNALKLEPDLPRK